MTKQENLLKNGGELLIETLIGKCVDTYSLSDIHIRSDQSVAIREHGEIIMIPDDVVSGQDINKFLQRHLDTFHYEKLNKEMQLDTAFIIQGIRYRANLYHSLNGVCMVLRKIETIIPVVEELDIPPVVLDACEYKNGLILITGPTGSGKSTTLYSILKEVSKPHLNILTAEDPVEYELDGVGQVQIKDDIGLTFASALRSFLRQDPEIILVGEMRDKETVDIGLKAALTGHLVFSTLHTNDAPSTITRLQNMGTPDYLISAACQLVLAQRLARRTCKECRVPDEDVTPKVLQDLGFTAEQASRAKAFKGKGCPKCKDTGYKGRQGIYEILVVSKPLKEAILRQATTPELREIAVKEGFQTMQDMGRRLISSGDLNFREYERVLTSE